MSNYKLELLCNIKNILGEGPIYNYGNDTMSFVDIVGQKLCIFDNNNIKEIKFDEKIGASIPINNNSFLVLAESKIYLYKNNQISIYEDISSITGKGLRCNDAKADINGRLYFSTMVDDGIQEPHGGLYYINDDNQIICLDNNTKLGNGLAWNKDNTKFYYSDSLLHKVFVYDYDINTGLLSNKKPLFEIKDGVPDGMTIDLNDNLFVAVWGGSRVEIRSSIDGSLLDTISVPTKLVTSCAFVGKSFNKLVITTAKLDETDEYAGNIFITSLDYKGKKEYFVKEKNCETK